MVSRFERRGTGMRFERQDSPTATRLRRNARKVRRSRSFVRLSNCIHPPEKLDATVIHRDMDAESGWEPRRGAFRVPRALAEGGGDSMSVEENLRVMEKSAKALKDRDLDTFESLHLNSVVQRDPQNPQGIKGPKAIRAILGPFLKAFPDIRMVTETQFGAGDWVTQLGHIPGTNTRPLEIPGAPTIPATNKSVRMPVAMIAKLEGGKFAEINLYFDQAGLMTQLGLTPHGPPQRKP